MRSVDEILTGDALTWSTMDAETLRHEHELLRRQMLAAREQIALMVPMHAYRHCAWQLCLAHNLSTAAGLCRAFALGEYFERDTAIGGWRLEQRWAPGCGKPAP